MKINLRNLAYIAVIAASLAVVYAVLTTREHRSLGEKLGDATAELGNGVDKAARALKDRTPAEKFRDEAGDLADKAKKK